MYELSTIYNQPPPCSRSQTGSGTVPMNTGLLIVPTTHSVGVVDVCQSLYPKLTYVGAGSGGTVGAGGGDTTTGAGSGAGGEVGPQTAVTGELGADTGAAGVVIGAGAGLGAGALDGPQTAVTGGFQGAGTATRSYTVTFFTTSGRSITSVQNALDGSSTIFPLHLMMENGLTLVVRLDTSTFAKGVSVYGSDNLPPVMV